MRLGKGRWRPDTVADVQSLGKGPHPCSPEVPLVSPPRVVLLVTLGGRNQVKTSRVGSLVLTEGTVPGGDVRRPPRPPSSAGAGDPGNEGTSRLPCRV
jgi:hypothetical protein